MAKVKRTYVCQECGARSPKWMGRCIECGGWNTFVEHQESVVHEKHRGRQRSTAAAALEPTPLSEIEARDVPRVHTGMDELDRVLGGGLVPGSLMLLGGDPGIGKSTLAMQMAAQLAQQEHRVLVVSGEESLPQAHMRAKRLGLVHPKILMLAEVDVEQIRHQAKRVKPRLLVVDSIQSVFCSEVGSTPGSVAQIRESTSRFMQMAKTEGISTLLIGHVTKDGAIAGPRVLEHMVDTVLYFEGGRGNPYRILRTVKNRFGSTHEMGVFEMTQKGLQEVANPSALFLEQRPVDAAGSVVTVSMEGSRPLLIEVQALVGSPVYGTPRRTCSGFDHNRLALLVAVLEKSGQMQISSSDIFVNIAGGYRLDEPAADLAVAMALASSFAGKPIFQHTAIVGEVGLTGEVRGVSQIELRVKEAMKLGFAQIVLPHNNVKGLAKSKKTTYLPVKTLEEALEVLFPR